MDIQVNRKKPTFIMEVDTQGNPVEIHETDTPVADGDIEFEVKEDGRKFYPLTRFEKGDLADVDYQREVQRVYVQETRQQSATVRLVSSDGYLSDPVSMPTKNVLAALVEESVELKEQPDTSLKIYCQSQFDLLEI